MKGVLLITLISLCFIYVRVEMIEAVQRYPCQQSGISLEMLQWQIAYGLCNIFFGMTKLDLRKICNHVYHCCHSYVFTIFSQKYGYCKNNGFSVYVYC